MKAIKFTLILIVLLSITILLSAAQTLGTSIKGDPQDSAKVMGAFFGNHIPGLGVSYLESSMTKDPQLLDWKIASRTDITELEGFGNLSSTQKSALLAYVGNIPVKYLQHWLLSKTQMLLLFEAGSWDFDLESWGGTGFVLSHNMGGAVYQLINGAWQCTGYELDLGKFGAYRNTTLNPDPLYLGNNTYAVQTLDYSSALIGINKGLPKVILRAPCWHGFGHGSLESYQSQLSAVPGEYFLYDVRIESNGETYPDLEFGDTETETKPLHQIRIYQYDAEMGEYNLISSQGNIEDLKDGGGWFPYYEEEEY